MKRRGPALILALLALGGALPAQADTTVPAPTESPAAPASAEPITTPVAPTTQAVPTAPTPPPGLTIAKQERYVAQGVSLTRYERLESIGGWVEAQVLTVDLTQEGVKTDLLWSGKVADRNTVSNLVQSSGAVAGLNADYFDTATVGAPLSGAMTGGQILFNSTPSPGWGNVAGVGGDRLGRLTTLALEGQIQIPTGARPLDRLNQQLNTDEVGLFTTAWGTTPRRNAAIWGARLKEVHVRDGKVVAVYDSAPTVAEAIPADTQILLGREAGADWLAGLKVGDPVSITWAPKTGDGQAYQYLVGGNQIILKDGKVVATEKTLQPRSAIGFSADGRRMFLVAVDGRSGRSAGMSLISLGQFLQELGAASAINLDGGGSTALVAKPAGAAAPSVVNTPSDGVERRVANGVGVWVNPGSGQVKRLQVDLAADRIFPGLSRGLSVATWDESGAAVPAKITWAASQGLVQEQRYVAPAAANQGVITLTARTGALSATNSLRLLGPLQTLMADQPKLSLNGMPVAITLIGKDASGMTAPIDGADAVLSYDKSRLKVELLPDGRLEVTPLQASFTTWLTAMVQGKLTMIQVTAAQALNTLSQRSAWQINTAPQGLPITLEAAPGYLSPGLKLTYDFTTSTATRAAYLLPASTLTLPGRPERIGLWVKGDGQGAWLRTVLKDAKGKSVTVDLVRNVDWTDWRYVEGAIPGGLSYPLSLVQLYPVEPTATRQYKGALTFSDLRLSSTSAGVASPSGPAATIDLTLLTTGDLPNEGYRFAFLPTSAPVTVRQQAIDSGARVIFSAGPVPSLESVVMGAPTLEVPHAPVTSLDTLGTRFVALDASKGSLWATDLKQLSTIQSALQSAETAPVQQVILLANRSLSAWTDQREAALIRSWLSDFRLRTGKGVALIGEGGTVAGATRFDGARLVNLPVGTGWYLGQVGSGAQWLRMAPRP